MKRFFYLPLEPLKARYTSQLGSQWIPAAFEKVNHDCEREYRFIRCQGPDVSADIVTGSVLDGVNRGIVSLGQMSSLLHHMMFDNVNSGDVIYLQDMWTPGLEAVVYAAHQRGIKLRIYAMCHAQSVDEYDFTYPMRSWMRPVEVAYSRMFSGLFVASTIHRDQLRAAGYECPIHVVGLPIHADSVMNMMPESVATREQQVIFTSRLNNEKNPYFMLDVADKFLAKNRDWKWICTTSASGFTSEVPDFERELLMYADAQPRFKLYSGLTKEQYYLELSQSQVQFNCSLQDYVSWTLLEATAAGCDLCYPDWRSFKECVPVSRRYEPFQLDAALDTLQHVIENPGFTGHPLERCNNGLHIEMAIMLQDWDGPEVNVWHQPASYFKGAGLL
jgi:glycosyltransferase involved in cell wall biosynthesis